ncbi:SEL1-like repeat protein, partial [Psychrobacter sp. TB20-MNA-CIBAN-0197]|uniref:SEL1-like repeat protein n=1 Tax=Psychrobacter sp. TB20-MNA-CIBAN-0197 TaxID=3140453 RepID=UPI0033221B80
CQLVQDIEARANKMALPSYQFLYGDMLAYNVCVDRNVELGVYYMRKAAEQGLAAAREQVGR